MPATGLETTRLLLTVAHCPMPSFTRGIQCSPTIMFVKPLQVKWSTSSLSLVRLTQLTFLVSIGDTSRSGSKSSCSCSGREIHEGRLITRKPMASLSGETPPTKVVAIEPILGSVKYEARSHYHSVQQEASQGSLQHLLEPRHCQQRWWLLSQSWGPSSMKPGAITILFLEEIIFIQVFRSTVSRVHLYLSERS